MTPAARLAGTALLTFSMVLLASPASADQLIQIPTADRPSGPHVDYRHRIDGKDQGYGTLIIPAGAAYEVMARWNNGFGGDHDLEAGASLQLLPDGIVTPAIAVGIWDVTNSGPMGRRAFLVVTKSLRPGQLGIPLFLGGAQVTVGLGTGRFSGPMAGLRLDLTGAVSLVGEYDARRLNFGLWVQPLPLVRLRAELQNGDPYLGGEFRLSF